MDTKIFKITDCSHRNKKILTEAAETIKAGGLVVFPTETVYGLGADATNEIAVGNIYKAKGRPSDNPLIIHIADPMDANLYTYTNETYYLLARKFMPGPLTVVLKSRENIPKKTRGGLSTVAVRCPENSIARELIKLSERPIAAPSANLSGTPSPTCANHVIDDLTGRVDIIIDGGDSTVGVESTIVKIDDDGALVLLRPGKITLEELSGVADVRVADAVTRELEKNEIALSPGMKYRHYAPKADFILLDGSIPQITEYVGTQGENVALVIYSQYIADISQQNPNIKCYDFGDENDIEIQAHRLFAILREIDKAKFDLVFAPLPQRNGIGLAVYNRMIRAAAHKIIKL